MQGTYSIDASRGEWPQLAFDGALEYILGWFDRYGGWLRVRHSDHQAYLINMIDRQIPTPIANGLRDALLSSGKLEKIAETREMRNNGRPGWSEWGLDGDEADWYEKVD